MKQARRARKARKVLFLQPAVLPYRKAVFNGLAADYDVTVLHGGPPTAMGEDRYREIVRPATPLGPFIVQRGVLKAVEREQWDVVICVFDLRWIAYLGAFLRLRPGVRRIFWGHAYGRKSVVNRIRDVLRRRADGFLLYGAEPIAELLASGMDAARLFVANNTLDVPNSHDASGCAKSSLLYAGRLSRYKRLDLLLDQFARVQGAIPAAVRLEIVGEPPEAAHHHHPYPVMEGDALRRQARALGIADRVIFHGRIDDADLLAPIFARAFALVSPGHVGLAALHAFAYGVPVITHDRPADHAPEFENLEHGVNSLAFSREDDLGDAMVKICNSPTLARSLGHRAYEHYATKRSLSNMLASIQGAIEGPGDA